MNKKNLNWKLHPALAKAFDRLATARRGLKGKWIVAAASVMMYVEAKPEDRAKYEQVAANIVGGRLPKDAIRIVKKANELAEAEEAHLAEIDEDDAQRDLRGSRRKRQGT